MYTFGHVCLSENVLWVTCKFYVNNKLSKHAIKRINYQTQKYTLTMNELFNWSQDLQFKQMIENLSVLRFESNQEL